MTKYSHQTAPESAQNDPITFDEFFKQKGEDEFAEWLDGVVITPPTPGKQHQEIHDFLNNVIRIYAGNRHLGSVRNAPFIMRLHHSARKPDLMFIKKENLERVKETFLDGPADLVVEVVCPESKARDRVEKFDEYADAGVLEYWLVDPQRRWAEFYRHGKEGIYQAILSGREGMFHSAILSGFWLKIEWLWQDSLPQVLDVLKVLKVT